MRAIRAVLCACALLTVAACGGVSVWADDETIAAVSYSDESSHSLTLYTMINNRTGAGGHSSLVINASETVLFDPAGSFRATNVPERNDVLFGFTPKVELMYRSAHARSTHHVVVQRVEVSRQQAQIAYQLALRNGPVAGAFCASATSGLLRQVPGFENTIQTFYPERLMEEFGKRPDVKTERYYENDAGTIEDAVAAL